MSGESSKDRKSRSNPGPETSNPFDILGIERSMDLSNPLVKEGEAKASSQFWELTADEPPSILPGRI